MSDCLYVTATEARSGKSLVCLGLMELLLRKIDKVGFFRPIIDNEPGSGKRDNDIELISSYFKLEIPYEKMYGYTCNELVGLAYKDLPYLSPDFAKFADRLLQKIKSEGTLEEVETQVKRQSARRALLTAEAKSEKIQAL